MLADRIFKVTQRKKRQTDFLSNKDELNPQNINLKDFGIVEFLDEQFEQSRVDSFFQKRKCEEDKIEDMMKKLKISSNDEKKFDISSNFNKQCKISYEQIDDDSDKNENENNITSLSYFDEQDVESIQSESEEGEVCILESGDLNPPRIRKIKKSYMEKIKQEKAYNKLKAYNKVLLKKNIKKMQICSKEKSTF